MGPDFEEKSKKEITGVIKNINLSWVEGHPENLGEYFHENMMIVSPELEVKGKGKEACIKSYVDFINRAKVNGYTLGDPDIYVFGNTAIVSYKYDIAWEMNGQLFKESGRDLFVLTRADGKWLAVWRKLIPKKEK